jgi:gluconokinase
MAPEFVVMGVSGSGKSTLAQALASRWAVPYIEGDHLHSHDSINKMAAGTPLADDDRWPWLDRVGAAILASRSGDGGAVASCSALRLVYRDRLRRAVGPSLRFVLIDLPRAVLESRMDERPGHFMPPALLDSQLRTLEPPLDEADVLTVDGQQSLDTIVDTVSAWHAREAARRASR